MDAGVVSLPGCAPRAAWCAVATGLHPGHHARQMCGAAGTGDRVTASIDYLPIWKKDATACERLQEIAEIARKYPERFDRLLVVYESVPDTSDGGNTTKIRYACNGCDTTTLLGLIEEAKEEIHVVTRGARIP